MDIFLRDKTKYGNSYTTPDDALHAAREKLHELMEQNGIVLDDLYSISHLSYIGHQNGIVLDDLYN
jgi:hypothetical protein